MEFTYEELNSIIAEMAMRKACNSPEWLAMVVERTYLARPGALIDILFDLGYVVAEKPGKYYNLFIFARSSN